RFPDSPWQPPERKTIQEFVKEVESQGVVCTLRRSRGKDIQAACGQLAGRNV
ncbi:MAG TPA: 23S rRNA (adenine(2503)-C(2))-methyltransferase RlmN, partial [bacterium]|nr:23S rRNA (adenine(2503)-C(2))-methyltransferase RlmN [bacterium]